MHRYSNFSEAMRDDFTTKRPAQPLLFVDGTGGSLGKGVCHSELGSADFAGDCKQSRLTLSPLHQSEGNDHHRELRDNMPYAFGTFNTLSDAGCFSCEGETVPCRTSITADMQGVKSVAGQSLCCHSVWCECQASWGQHMYGVEGDWYASYPDVLKQIEGVGKCQFKSEEKMCNLAHVPLSYHRNGTWTKFKCPWKNCNYSPTKKQFFSDIATFQALTPEEQDAERTSHVELGGHYHQYLFMPPMCHFGMERIGVCYACHTSHTSMCNLTSSPVQALTSCTSSISTISSTSFAPPSTTTCQSQTRSSSPSTSSHTATSRTTLSRSRTTRWLSGLGEK